jgi:hypothetical protein
MCVEYAQHFPYDMSHWIGQRGRPGEAGNHTIGDGSGKVESSTQHPHATTNNPTKLNKYHLIWCTHDQSTLPNLILIAAAPAVAYQQNCICHSAGEHTT